MEPADTTEVSARESAPGETGGSLTWEGAEEFPCRLSVELQVPLFTVRHLFHLSPGTVVETEWAQSSDVPLFVNKELIGWAEFEVVGEGLAVRVTEFA